MEAIPEHWPSIAKSILATWARGGWIGVDLFFVLSGFLVSGLLFAEYRMHGRVSIARFYVRRGWKIYPSFFTMILVTILIRPFFKGPIGRGQILSEALFLQSYMDGIWNHTWSLSVEEHFYVILPIFLLTLLRLNRGARSPFHSIPTIAVVLAATSLFARIINYYYRADAYSVTTHLFPTHLRMDSLFFGVAIAFFYEFHRTVFIDRLWRWRRHLIGLGSLLLTPAFLWRLEANPVVNTVGLTVFYVGSGMLLVGVILCRAPTNRLILWLAALGTFSYSIYLWHMPMMEWGLPAIEKILGTKPYFAIRLCLYLVGSMILGVAMAKLIEFPALRIRDRWFPSPSRSSGEKVSNTDAAKRTGRVALTTGLNLGATSSASDLVRPDTGDGL
jgi:peptidoglycan/LPS O-acetylase OafA/YrhL